MAGRALGSLVGQGDLGALAGEQLSKLFGFGDYTTRLKGNSLIAGVAGNAVPKFQGDGKRGVRLTEREFIGNILSGPLSGGSSIFENRTYVINPKNPDTFPWLSRIAGLFDQWEPHGIVFEFHTTSSAYNGTSQALGAVIMATDYDVDDAPYANKQIMENADYACSTVPSTNLLHGVECDPSERPMSVMYTDSRPSNLKFSDLGNFQIATQGMSTADTTLGELWVSYDITFYKKQLVPAIVEIPFFSSTYIPIAIGSPIIQADHSSNLMRMEIVVGTGTDIFFPPSYTSGRFLVTWFYSVFGLGETGQIPTLYFCSNVPFSATNSGNAAGQVQGQRLIEITGQDAKLRFGLKSVLADRKSVV